LQSAGSDADVEGEGDENDGDFGSRKRRHTRSRKKSIVVQPIKAPLPSKPTAKPAPTSKPPQPSTSARTPKVTKTYARRSGGDTDNVAHAEASFIDDTAHDRSESSPAKGKATKKPPKKSDGADLKAAAAKFAAIDQWEMDYEDISGSLITPPELEGAR
jgi:hypothetical protein